MEEKLEDLIQNKTWSELTPDEQEMAIKELGSEEKFTAMKNLDAALMSSGKMTVTPDARILHSLKAAHSRKFERQSTGIFSWKMPAIAAAFCVLVAAFTGWYFGKSSGVVNAPSQIVMKDTVYIVAPRDTVFVNRVVYRNRIIYKPQEEEKSFTVVNQTEKPGIGVSMKDKEELERLLVSGTE